MTADQARAFEANRGVTMDQVRREGRKLAPGLYVYRECLHADPVEWMRGHGMAPTRANYAAAAAGIKRAAKSFIDGPQLDVHDATCAKLPDPSSN